MAVTNVGHETAWIYKFWIFAHCGNSNANACKEIKNVADKKTDDATCFCEILSTVLWKVSFHWSPFGRLTKSLPIFSYWFSVARANRKFLACSIDVILMRSHPRTLATVHCVSVIERDTHDLKSVLVYSLFLPMILFIAIAWLLLVKGKTNDESVKAFLWAQMSGTRFQQLLDDLGQPVI